METIYILGSGAIGFPLAAYLVHDGRRVVAVRTSRNDVPKTIVSVTVESGPTRLTVPVETLALSGLSRLDGLVVITAKSHANKAIARELQAKDAVGPIVIMQNGVGVERPFLDGGFSPIYRCVLYFTSQAVSDYGFWVRPVTASPIGLVAGSEAKLQESVERLTTGGFPFRAEGNIQREVWKKAIINCVFNSICPLLDVDNGVFVRDEEAASLAREIIRECITLIERLGMSLGEGEILDQLMRISRGSDGQLISTLQDIRSGRQTEIEFLNLEMVRIAASLEPELQLPRVDLLGRMIVAKSRQGNSGERP